MSVRRIDQEYSRETGNTHVILDALHGLPHPPPLDISKPDAVVGGEIAASEGGPLPGDACHEFSGHLGLFVLDKYEYVIKRRRR
jgi:hypothetical protein